MAALVRNPFLYLLIGIYVLSARRMASAQHRYAGDAIFTLLLFGVVAGVIAH